MIPLQNGTIYLIKIDLEAVVQKGYFYGFYFDLALENKALNYLIELN